MKLADSLSRNLVEAIYVFIDAWRRHLFEYLTTDIKYLIMHSRAFTFITAITIT